MALPENKLPTKVQYNTFEPGEFVEEKKRNYEEIIDLIENFPWEEQRKGIHIDLTCSSITIQGDVSTYLKFSLYYNGKFVLYFFDGKDLYSKSIFRYEESYEDIQGYLVNQSINYSVFKKQNTVFKHLKNHFISNDFIYQVYPDKPLKYLSGFTKFVLLMSIGLLIYAVINIKNHDHNIVIFLFIFFILYFPLLGGINLLLTINYFFHSKGKLLQLSKGSPVFKFGDASNPKTFQKNDVTEIRVFRNTAYRCPWGEFTISNLYMKDGTILKITNLLLSGLDIQFKMPSTKFSITQTYIPYIK